MKQVLLLFLLQFFSPFSLLFSQSGPAGVGTSTNNVLWLKADRSTSTTTSGSPISYWNDQSGNSNHVAQTTANLQPLYMSNVLNGFPGILFDNVSTTNDKMIGPDSPTLDNTAGYTFFTVSRPLVVDGEARVIVSKRTTVSVNQSFMLFYYTSNRFHVDIQTTNDRYQTATSFVANNNYIIDMVYDGSLAAASRSKTYIGESLDVTATETSATVPDNTSPLILGSTDASDGRPFGGYIFETIMYRTALNDASRIIVNNYLSAKYNIALTANDKYAGDNAGSGNYDFDVAGVGRESSGSNTSFASSVAAGIGVTINSGLDVGDYILAGHASATNAEILTDVTGMTGTSNSRWQRIWYFDVTNTSTAMNTNIEFDMSDGLTWVNPLGPVANYVLLYRAGTSGAWTELTTASAISGDKVRFNGVNISNDGYYTIGSRNYTLSPLPVELLDFSAVASGNNVNLSWQTASEHNNDFFTVQKSRDGIDFDAVFTVDGAGNSSSTTSYSETDYNPFDGTSYYRLKQTDFDGSSTHSRIIPVSFSPEDGEIFVFPNPIAGNEALTISFSGLAGQEVLVAIRNVLGQEFYSRKIFVPEDNYLLRLSTDAPLSSGTYAVTVTSGDNVYNRKLVVK